MSNLMIVGTGHQPGKLGCSPYPNECMAVVYMLIDRLGEEAEKLKEGGKLWVVSGMAEGFDLFLAAAAIMIRQQDYPVRLYAAIPFVRHERRFISPQAQAWVAKLIKEADQVELVSTAIGEYKARNQHMVDLPAKWKTPAKVWTAFNGEFRSGTAQTLRMAKAAGLPEPINFFDDIRRVLGIQ